MKSSRHLLIACAALLLGIAPWTFAAAESPAEQSASGTFVSFKEGVLSIKGKSGLCVYRQVGANYKTFQNNENGPGAKQVETVDALGRVMPGAVVQVDVPGREISFGLDYRVIGAFESYQDGKLQLLAADAPPGFVKKPTGKVTLTVAPGTPVLASIAGGDYQIAGSVGEVLKTVKPGTLLTARSEYDVDIVEVLQMGEPRRRMERYIGQTRGPVRGTFVSFKQGILRIRGKGLTTLAANEYDRLIGWRIADTVPIVESIDGGPYQPAAADALNTVKEGTILTIRKIEDVIFEVQIGMAKTE